MSEPSQAKVPSTSGCFCICYPEGTWAKKHPKTIGVVIALIFAIGALVAHYVLSASLGWPVGIGVAGFIVSSLVMAKLYRTETPFEQLMRDIAYCDPTAARAKLVARPELVTMRCGDNSVLWWSVHTLLSDENITAEQTKAWAELIRHIDTEAPGLKVETNPGLAAEDWNAPQSPATGRNMAPRDMVAQSPDSEIRNIFKEPST